MKNIILIIISFIVAYTLQAQSPNFEWVKGVQGYQGYVDHSSMDVDSAGNIYSIGKFGGTVDFNPSFPVFYNLTSTNNYYSNYIQKLNANGNLAWVRTVDFRNGNMRKLSFDSNGNLYIMGGFKDSVDIDPGTGVHMLYSNGGYDVFILKLTANGNFIWGKSFGGAEDDAISDIATDLQGNVYTHGFFEGAVDFDPGIGTSYLGSTNSNIESAFLQKFDKYGNFIWVKAFSANEYAYCKGKLIDIDSYGNVYFTGLFVGNVDFDPGQGTSYPPANNSSMYLVKLDSMGNFIWARFSAKVGISGYASPDAMKVDRFNNIYTTGKNSGPIDYDPGPDTLLLYGSAFIQKYDQNGYFLWAKSYGYRDSPMSLATDTFGNVYSTGLFRDSTDLDPGPDTLVFYTTYGAYIQKLNPMGNLLWAGVLLPNNGWSIAYNIFVDNAENIFVGGNYGATVDFDPGIGVQNQTAVSQSSDSYVLKLSQCKTITTDYVTACDSLIWMDGVTYYESGQAAYYTLPSSTGCDSVICLSLNIPNIDATISIGDFGGSFTANQGNASYQWLDCNNALISLLGDTMQTYIPTLNGDYAVELNVGGCIDTSACVHISNVSIDEISGNTIRLFPNPNSGEFMLDNGNIEATEVKILNTMGQVIFVAQNPKDQYFNINLKSGIYFMEIRSNNGAKTIKFVVN